MSKPPIGQCTYCGLQGNQPCLSEREAEDCPYNKRPPHKPTPGKPREY